MITGRVLTLGAVCCREAQIEPPAFQIVSDRRGKLSLLNLLEL